MLYKKINDSESYIKKMKSSSTATEYECRDASHAGSWYSEDEK